MEDINHQEDSTEIDNDVNEDEDINHNEDTSETGEDSDGTEQEDWGQPMDLDEKLFHRLKQNDSGVTNVSVSLTERYFSQYFNSIDWKVDGGCIANNTQLKRLYMFCGDSILGEEGQYLPTRQQLQDFFSCIYRSRSIKELHLGSIHIVDKFGEDLIEGLCGHHSLTRLDIGPGVLGSVGCRAIGKVLKHEKSKLKDLRFTYCKLDNEKIHYLSDALLGNMILNKLCLIGNREISSVGWRVISTVLQHPDCKLVELDLDSSGITDETAAILGSGLSRSSLKTLDLGYSPSISSASYQMLLAQLSKTSIVNLDLNATKIDE